MANLTIQQENFCLEYIKSGNASDAYRLAYHTEKMKGATINRNAKKLMDDNKIATRIKELREPVIEKAKITLDSHLEDLRELRDTAVKRDQIAAAITAEIARGKASGVYIEKSQVNLTTNPLVLILETDEGAD